MTRRAFLTGLLLFAAQFALADTVTTRLGFIIPTAGSYNWATKVDDWAIKIDTGAVWMNLQNTFYGSSNTFLTPVLMSGSSITLTGPNGYITSQSSITGTHFGDGEYLTGIPSTGSIVGVYLPISGGAMSGTLGLTYGGIQTITGTGVATSTNSYAISAGTAPVGSVNGANVTITAGNSAGTGDRNGGEVTLQAGAGRNFGSVGTVNIHGYTTVDNSGATGGVGPSSVFSVTGSETISQNSTIQGSAFSVGGASFTVTGGNVGIGTSNPAWPLSVSGGRFAVCPSGNCSDANGRVELYDDGTEGILDAYKTGLGYRPIWEYGNFIINSGSLGVGTTNPQDSLDVNGAIRAESNSTGFYSSSSTIVDFVPGTLTGRVYAVTKSAAIPDLALGAINNVGVGPSINFHGQNIGIGTTNPGASLDVAGGIGHYSRTVAQLLAITPAQLGVGYYCSDCSPAKLVVSTGTSAGNFADAVGGPFK